MMSPAIKKAFVLLSCTFLGLICGTLYLYSSYSPQFAKKLGYSATDSSSIALMGTIGMALSGPLAGSLVDKRGYTLSLLLGGCLIVSGYLTMKRQFDEMYSNLSLSAVCIFSVGCGSTFINSACLKCCAISFPSIRGVATSLPLALYGLSALFYSVFASVLFPGDTSKFLGFVAYSSVALLLLCAPSVIICDREHKSRKSVMIKKTPLDLIEVGSSKAETSQKYLGASDLSEYDKSNSNLLYSWTFWGIFIVTGSLAALGQMYIYSVGYMVKALITKQIVSRILRPIASVEEVIQRDQQLQVGLLSVANCMGRIASGVLGDILQSFHKPRSWLLYIPCLGLMFSQSLGYSISEYQNLSPDSFLTGFFYGFTFCIMPIIVGDTFGMSNFSFNWGLVGLAPILPSYYLTSLFGEIYDAHSMKVADFEAYMCTAGSSCYKSIFRITLPISMFTFVVITLLNFGPRLSERYRNTVIDKKRPLKK